MRWFIFCCDFSGVEDGLWYLDLKNGHGSSGKGKPEGKPDCTISMDYKSLLDLISGMFYFMIINFYVYFWILYHLFFPSFL